MSDYDLGCQAMYRVMRWRCDNLNRVVWQCGHAARLGKRCALHYEHCPVWAEEEAKRLAREAAQKEGGDE